MNDLRRPDLDVQGSERQSHKDQIQANPLPAGVEVEDSQKMVKERESWRLRAALYVLYCTVYLRAYISAVCAGKRASTLRPIHPCAMTPDPDYPHEPLIERNNLGEKRLLSKCTSVLAVLKATTYILSIISNEQYILYGDVSEAKKISSRGIFRGSNCCM